MESKQQYTKDFFKGLSVSDREKALKIATEFVKQGATRLMNADSMSTPELGNALWDFYWNRVIKPPPPKNKGGRPNTDWQKEGRPFLEGTRLGIIWDCLMRNPKVGGFEDRVREELIVYSGPIKGPSVAKTPLWNLFIIFYRGAFKRGFRIMVDNPVDGSAQYKVVRMERTPRWLGKRVE